MKNLFALTVSCLFAALPLKAAVIEADFSKGSNLRLLNGAELKDGILFIKGGKSCAEVAGTEKIKLGKSGLTVSCVAAFDKLPAWGQDLFWKKECWMLSRFNNGMMTAYLHNGEKFVSRSDGGEPAEPGVWNAYTLVIKPFVQVEEGKYGYIIEIYINGELVARTENSGYTINESSFPVTLGWGKADAESRVPLGVVVVGGLIFSQIVTLYITPVVYLWIDKLQCNVFDKIPFFARGNLND